MKMRTPARKIPGTKRGDERLYGCPEGAQVYAALRLCEGGRLAFIATDQLEAEFAAAQLAFFAPERKVALLPSWDTDFYSDHPPDVELAAGRIAALEKLCRDETDTLIATPKALLQKSPAAEFLRAGDSIEVGAKIKMEFLSARLVELGYRRSETVCERGCFAVRGGIIDVFAVDDDSPKRLDFLGDEVESIRSFDPVSQRSPKEKDPPRILRLRAAKEFSAVAGLAERLGLSEYELKARLYAFAGMLPPKKVSLLGGEYRFFAENPLLVFSSGAQFPLDALAKAHANLKEPSPPPGSLFLTRDELERQLAAYQRARLSPFAGKAETINGLTDGSLAPGRGRLGWFKSLKGKRVAAVSAAGATRLAELLKAPVAENYEQVVAASHQMVVARLPLLEGFKIREGGEVIEFVANLLPMRLTMGRGGRGGRGLRRVASEPVIRPPQSGELLVHRAYGIGKFEGMEEVIASDGSKHDCLALLYAGGDRLLIPVENFHHLSRYGGGSEGAVKLDSLGGTSWQERRARTKNRIRSMCAELVKAEAERKFTELPPISVDEESYGLFVAGFGWDETEDQLAVIKQVEADMLKPHPTDRLICGDAGFGKTEVCLRAAFLIAMGGKQVAVLTPSAILAKQHYELFCERFAEFPVKLAMLSRLVAPAAARRAREQLASGELDVVIGTHALLAKNVHFRSPGLIVIDEEHRFGVQQKERLKSLKGGTHVLSLSATPIPRTLHMAFGGLKELSSITTPPPLRSAVKTFIIPLDFAALEEPIGRELARRGGVFCVAPKIADLEKIRVPLEDLVSKMTVKVKIAVAHAKLANSVLEETMLDFRRGSIDILLSTDIIGSGLDIPRANTLIVFDAQKFGLAQLYQLRGRVGRSRRRALAYFTYPPHLRPGKAAVKRLKVIKSLDHLGVGLAVASHDLDIRGAGNLLGSEQSGQIREVGVELYQKMVEEEARRLRGAKPPPAAPPTVKISGVSMGIPPSYVGDEQLKIKLYKRLSEITEPTELEEFISELKDRFGPRQPPELTALLKVMAIRLKLASLGVAKMEVGKEGAALSFRRPLRLKDWGPFKRKFHFNQKGEMVVPNCADSGQDYLEAAITLSEELSALPEERAL